MNLNRYEEIELGSARANLNTVINDTVDSAIENAMSDIEIDTGFLEEEMFNMSKLIANGMGLHITKDSQGRIYLHNEEQLSNSQYQYEITSNGFMLSDDYGQTWNSGWDISGNAVVNSLATITLKFLQGYGMYMRFGDVNSNYIEVAPYSDSNNNPQGVSFDGSGSVRFQPQNEFEVRNISSNNDLYNYIFLKHQSNQNRVLIENYWYDDPQYLANYIQLISNTVNNALSLVNKQLNSTDAGNSLTLNSSSSLHAINVTNYKRSSTDTANKIIMQNGTTNSGVWLYNYQYSNTNLASYMSVVSTSSKNSYTITNNNFGGNTSANKIALESDTANSLELSNYNSSGTLTNSIIMDSAETNTIWSSNDLRLRSGGAVRIVANYNTSSGQDIYLDAKTLKLIYYDKLSLYDDGTEHSSSRHNIYFDSSGYVRWN